MKYYLEMSMIAIGALLLASGIASLAFSGLIGDAEAQSAPMIRVTMVETGVKCATATSSKNDVAISCWKTE